MISIRGGWRVAALLAVFLAGTVAGAGAASTALMTRLMQDPPTEGTPEPGSATTVVVHSDPQAVVDDQLSDVDLVPGGVPGTVRLYRLFPAAQLSGDSADWSARSSDTSVVTVGFDLGLGTTRPPYLWIRPLGTGEATITAGYTGFGNSVSYSFTVTVADPTPATATDPPDTFDPVALPDPQGTWDRNQFLDLQAGGTPVTRLVTEFIRANDQMAEYSRYWSARSSDASVVTVSLARRPTQLQVWVWPEGTGEATITLAYARHGKSAATRFTVRVGADGAPGAPAPVANVQAVVNEEVVDQAGGLEPGGRSVAIDVNDLFVNVGGATGRDFSATSSDGRVVTVEVTDNPHVVIRPVGEGVSTVTVRYTAGGRSVRTAFGVAVGEDFVAPVPALPLAAAGLLAALLFGAGLQRRRRNR